MDQTNSIEVKQKIKELYKRPGGLFAKITGILVIVALGYGFAKLLPFLIAAAANFLIFILELIGISALVALILNKDFRRGLQLIWLQLMRKMYGAIVNIDPIAILQNGINEMKKKLQTVTESITRLESLNVTMGKKLKEYKEAFERYAMQKRKLESSAGVYKDQMEQMRADANLRLVNNNLSRCEKQITAQTARINTSKRYLEVMKKLEIAAKFKVDDAEEELKFRKEEFEAAKEQTKAIRAVTSIFNGGLSRTMEEELAMTNVEDTISTSIAEMNRMLDGSNEILANFELDTDINAAKADKILEMFDRDGFSIFDRAAKNNEGGKYVLPHTMETTYEEVAQPVATPEPVSAKMTTSKYFN